MVRAGDLVRVSFTAPVQKVGAGDRVWLLVNGCWFSPDEYETTTQEEGQES
jgi:hypothetical protein